MSTYAVEEHAGRVADVLTDPGSGTRLMISRVGAELVSLARQSGGGGDWRGFLYRDGEFEKAASGWNNHATVMGYFVHRLKEQRSVYRGHEIRGGTHGFLRHATFEAPVYDESTASLTYAMTPAEYGPTDYPFRLGMRLTYGIEPDGGVRVRFEFTNEEPEQEVVFSFGLHPGFAVESLAECQVLLPAGTYRRYLAPGDFLSGETIDIEHLGGPMPFDKAALPGSYLLDLAGVPDRQFTVIDPSGGRRVELDYAQAPYLTLWSDGSAFICVEPCWGLPDHAEQRAFEDKLGLQTLAPGATVAREFVIHARVI